jgi:energy-coupling factor transporter ATP-binding protein EcfA2
VEAAKERIQYHAERLHFAICGASGSGKSSLINAFRGLWTDDPDAAAVGNNETTLGVTRYPDPRQELPYPRFVWCDVPGAGTFNIPAWQYFNQQGLFIFDFIILVYDNVRDRCDLCSPFTKVLS